jgi:UTP-glucose-1-phosphate uridylyltransferase
VIPVAGMGTRLLPATKSQPRLLQVKNEAKKV